MVGFLPLFLSRSLAHRISVIQIYRGLDYTQTNKVFCLHGIPYDNSATLQVEDCPRAGFRVRVRVGPGEHCQCQCLCNSVLSREDTQDSEAVLIPIEYKEWITD